MNFLKKPIFIKKTRFYKNNILSNELVVTSSHEFQSKRGSIKSSYFQNVMDLEFRYSSLNLKGSYFYISREKNQNSPYFYFYKNIYLPKRDTVTTVSTVCVKNSLVIKMLCQTLFSIVVLNRHKKNDL